MKSLPKVTVVTVCFNCKDTIERTLQNVLKQTYPYIEYIVIDGGSTDGTKLIIEQYAGRLSYWVSEPDGGIYDAMNKGIRKATGEWILFRNAGDYFFSSSTIEDVFKWYEDRGEAVIAGGTRNFGREGYHDKYCPLQTGDVWHDAFISHPSAFIRMTVQKAHPYATSYRIASDYGLFQTLMLEGQTIARYDAIVSLFDCEDGISSTQLALAWKEIWQIRRALGAPENVLKMTERKYVRIRWMSLLMGLLKKHKRLYAVYRRKRQMKGWTLQPLSLTLQHI